MGKKENKEEQIRRIALYEEKLNDVQAALEEMERALGQWEKVQQDIEELEAYYRSDRWKRDFRDDEAGKLPDALKRGVLSEDGIYDALEKNAELKERIVSQEEG